MIRNRDFIVIGLQALDSRIGSNCINLAYEFAKHNRVLYVNYPLDRLTKIRERKDPLIQKRIRINKGIEPALVQINDNMWNLYPQTTLESISQLPYDGLFDRLNKINNKRFARQIRKAVQQLGFKDYFIFNDSDMFRGFYLKELLQPEMYIYYTRDNLIAVDYWKRQGIRIEARLMEKADLIVANSTYLAEHAKQFNPYSYYVGQGCDVSLFDKQLIQDIPKDIASIPKPIIGYIGALFSLRLDIEVLSHIAKQNPEWSVVLVGPEDDTFKNSELHQLDNVYFLGAKKMEELPSYLFAFDAAINPQKLNEVTIGNYPRKIDEYLAMGKPTVATRTKAMEVFEEYTYLAETKEEYVSLIEKALQENNSELEASRELFARSHTWENNVKEIYNRMIYILQKPQ
ncbi:MAG: glycosyltransferase [Bacteroidales bacterium]|jgi:glycosyltransferase involved in cell wall biosynthesis|nr:glycosyltransferase [Bacteroidales bacterium]MDD3701607.1 glycosyltransferase [Bacteroidales bacterium]MDY0369804.1 glycosyltransferase [Bacteroidales bacterium]